jgi:hypothetical protein
MSLAGDGYLAVAGVQGSEAGSVEGAITVGEGDRVTFFEAENAGAVVGFVFREMRGGGDQRRVEKGRHELWRLEIVF